MSQTMNASARDLGLELKDAANLLPKNEAPASFTDFFDWQARADPEDAGDARETRRLYQTAGVAGFTRIG